MKYFKFEDFYKAEDMILNAKNTDVAEEIIITLQDFYKYETLEITYDFIQEKIMDIQFKFNNTSNLFEDVNGSFSKETLKGLTTYIMKNEDAIFEDIEKG